MALDTYSCPECQATLRISPNLKPGDLVQCPRCRVQFPVPDTGAFQQPLGVTAQPPSFPGDPSFTEAPLPSRPRFAEVEEENVTDTRGERKLREPEWDEDYPRPSEGYGGPYPPLSSDYTIDLGRWFAYASAHWGAILGASVGFAFLYGLINLVVQNIPFLGPLISLFVVTPLAAGWTVVALAQLKGRRWSFNDFFNGFNWWGAIVGNTLLQGFIVLGCAIPGGVIALLSIGFFGPGDIVTGMTLVVGGAALAVLLAAYVSVRTSFFALPLIIDRGFGATEAIAGSWTLSRGHFWGLFGVVLLLGLINLGGLLLCFVGLLFTIPLTTLVTCAGYLLVAGSRPPVELPEQNRPADF
jgi:hypothetical protein